MKFIFAGALLRFVDYEREVSIGGSCLEEGLHLLVQQYPSLQSILLDNQGNLRRTHQIFLNGEQLEKEYYMNQSLRKDLPLQPNDSIYFLTAIAGG